MNERRGFLRFFLSCVTLLALPAAAQTGRIWIVQSEAGGVYAETVAVLRLELAGMPIQEGLPATVLDAQDAPPSLIVTVGSAAFAETLRWLNERTGAWGRIPVLATLLPRAAYQASLPLSMGRPVSAVWLDQPWSRQFALLRRALPMRTRIGILPGPETRAVLREIEAEARAFGLRLVIGPPIDVAEKIYPSLREVLLEADVLFAVPDALVYNAATLRNILLTAYRARVPLVAFSAAYAKAGALYAVYATPAQIARQAATLVRAFLAGRGLPPPQPPHEFAFVVNERVAASLGIVLDDANRIAESQRAAERP